MVLGFACKLSAQQGAFAGKAEITTISNMQLAESLPVTSLFHKLNVSKQDFPPHALYSIFDACGKRIFYGKGLNIQMVNQLPKGFYFLKVFCQTGTWTIEIKQED